MSATQIGQKISRATVLITPYFRLYNESVYSMKRPFDLIRLIQPHKIVNRLDGAPDHDYMIKWGKYIEDPNQIRLFTPKMAGFWINEQELAKN